MIISFGNSLARDLFDDKKSSIVRHFPQELIRNARRKLLYLHDIEDLQDLRVLPGNRLEALKGRLKGYYSIRINNQWRVVFRWISKNVYNAQIIDYH